MGYVWISILILFVTTYFTRMLPLVLCKGTIKNRFIKSVLAYLPYAVLTSLIFPEIFEISGMGFIPGLAGLIVAVFLAYIDKGLVMVLAGSTIVSYIFMLLRF